MSAGFAAHFGSDASGDAWLWASRCPACAAVLFPVRAACPVCGNLGPLDRVPIGRSGRLEEATVCHVAPEGFSAPYVLGSVALPEGPRVVSIVDVAPEQADAVVGAPVELVIGPIGREPDGTPIVAWAYRPAGGG